MKLLGLRRERSLAASVPENPGTKAIMQVDELAADDEFRCSTEEARRGILLIRSLTDNDVLAGARDSASKPHQHVFAILGPTTNPHWITSQCAEEAYKRDLIDERELDYLMD
jgi:hypothetical protein